MPTSDVYLHKLFSLRAFRLGCSVLRLVSGSRAASVSSNVAGSLTRPATRTPAHQAAATNNPQPIAHHPHCSNVSQPFSGPTAIQLWQHGAGTGSSVGRGTRATFLQQFAIKKQQFAIFVQQLAAFCISLHHVATLSCILQQFATICNILRQFATVCSILQHFASLLQHLATTLQPFAAFGSILQPFGSESVVFS